MVMKKLKFSQVKPGIANTPGFRSLKEIKQAGDPDKSTGQPIWTHRRCARRVRPRDGEHHVT